MGGRERGSGGGDGARSLKTAAVVLRALRLLGTYPDGLTPAELGAELGKSVATARYVINTLCDAGFAERDPERGVCRIRSAPPWGNWGRAALAAADPYGAAPGPAAEPLAGALAEATSALYSRTRPRVYLVARDRDEALLLDSRGHQGQARLPGLGSRIPLDVAHCWAATKILIADDAGGPGVVRRSRTPASATDPRRLAAELAAVRLRGWATDEEEFATGFCGIAAAVASPWGAGPVALAISVSARRYERDREELLGVVRAVAGEAHAAWCDEPAFSAPRR